MQYTQSDMQSLVVNGQVPMSASGHSVTPQHKETDGRRQAVLRRASGYLLDCLPRRDTELRLTDRPLGCEL